MVVIKHIFSFHFVFKQLLQFLSPFCSRFATVKDIKLYTEGNKKNVITFLALTVDVCVKGKYNFPKK